MVGVLEADVLLFIVHCSLLLCTLCASAVNLCLYRSALKSGLATSKLSAANKTRTRSQQPGRLLQPKLFSVSFALGAFCAAGVMSAVTNRAQSGGPFDLSWSTIAGGGGTSSGGQYQLSGTIGQPDPGVLSGGNFRLEGGYWSGITLVQTPGAPRLKITLLPAGKAVISWPVGVPGFLLEETATVADSKTWSAAPPLIVDTATEHTVTVEAVGVIRCYRLRKP